MRKIFIFSAFIFAFLALFFIPVSQQKIVIVKGSFISVYTQLANAQKWENWRPDIAGDIMVDSSKISIKRDSSEFDLKYDKIDINVKATGNVFSVNEDNNGTKKYSYAIGPDKQLNKSVIVVTKSVNLFHYLSGQLWPTSFADTHIDDFKRFMETDSLLYGYPIFKTKVPGSFLAVIRKEVLAKDKFTQAHTSMAELLVYIKNHELKQMQPVLAQFIPKGTDSINVNVGFFVDKEFKTDKDAMFARMPMGGPLYAAIYKGEFNKRQKAYNSLSNYLRDHNHETVIAPFDTYLDNKLPVSDMDKIRIQINVATF